VVGQTRWANTAAWRDPGWVFFAVAMPLGLYAFMVALYGDIGLRPGGQDFALFFAAGMTVYGAAVTAFVNMPEAVAVARDRGVLKRLRGTPLAPAAYLAGRTASVLWIALLTGALVLGTGLVLFDVPLSLAGLPVALLALALGTLTFAACGFALATVVPNSKAMTAVGLAVLLPLSFFSDVFLFGDTPTWMSTLGSVFPLKPAVHALADALDPAGPSLQWSDVAVMAAWLVVASLVAVRRFRWEARGSS
jgi:ABC-type multidrug transport system permease subunit